MAGEPADHDALIEQFRGLTGVARHEVSSLELSCLKNLTDELRKAQQYLATNQWDLSSAAAEYYTSLEEATEAPTAIDADNSDTDEEQSIPEPSVPRTTRSSGRTLGDDVANQPIPTTSSMPPPPSSSSKPPPKKKFATLGDLGGGGSTGHDGHGHDDDDEDDDENQDLFAGGEKSALAVQNPDDIKRKILERAKKLALTLPQFPMLHLLTLIHRRQKRQQTRRR